jgi:hypothetical protein
VIIALAEEGVQRCCPLFEKMKKGGRIIQAAGVEIPATAGQIQGIDFKARGIKKKEMALAACYLLARDGDPITAEMLEEALKQTFQGKRLEEARTVLEKAATI